MYISNMSMLGLITYINYSLLYVTVEFTISPGIEKIRVEFQYSTANDP